MRHTTTARSLLATLITPTAVSGWAVALDVLLFSTVVFGRRTGWQLAVTGVLAGAEFLALQLRRRTPVASVAATTGVALAGCLAGPFRGTVGVCVAQAAVVSGGARRVALAASSALSVLAAAGWAVGESRTHDGITAAQAVGLFVGYLAFPALATGIGVWQRHARERVEALERRRAEAAREAAAAERGRVARELHDIVAHSVTVMVLQTAGARQLLRSPDGHREAEELLAGVQRSGEQAMVELRRLLAALHGPDDPAGVPTPGLDDLGELLDAVRRGGVEVSLRHDGEPAELDPSVSMAAYRVVQEALTNIGKHAGPGTAAEVRLVWTAVRLLVQVTDDGRGRAARPGLSTGHGLVGLAERVALVGGSLTSGPGPEGGYRVSADLPAGAAEVAV